MLVVERHAGVRRNLRAILEEAQVGAAGVVEAEEIADDLVPEIRAVLAGERDFSRAAVRPEPGSTPPGNPDA